MRPHIRRVLSFPVAAVALLAFAAPGAGTAGAAAPAPGPLAGPAHPVTAYVANYFTGTVTPINTATNKALKAIPAGGQSFAIMITPDGKTAYVNGMSAAGSSVTPISTATNKAGKIIKVPGEAYAFAITPDSRTLYVADAVSNTVIPVSTAASKPGRAISVGKEPVYIAITPNGKTAYVANWASGTVTPITIATGKVGKPVKVGANPAWIAITPDGKTAYVANLASGTVTPIVIAAGKAGKPIPVGYAPREIVITPNGRTAYVASDAGVTPVSTATNRAGTAIKVGYGAIAITPDGKTLYAYSDYYGTVTPIPTAVNKPGKAIKVGNGIKEDTPPPDIAITPDGRTVYVSGAGLGLTPVSTVTGKAGKTIDVGGGGAIAITPAARAVAPASPGFQPAAASFWSPGSGVVLGAAGCAKLPCRAQLAATRDGGRHWQPVNTPGLQLVQFPGTGRVVSSVLFASRQDGWLYGGTGLWFTSDGGAHWRQLTLPGKVTVLAAAAGTAYAVVAPARGSAELFRSPVGRAAWARAGKMTAASPILAVSGRAAWFANGTSFENPPATYLWAAADGTHWHRYPFACPAGYGLRDIAAATPSHLMFLCTGSGFAGGEGKEIMASADGGKTAHLAGPAPAEGHPMGFAAPPGRPQVITLAAVSGGSWLDTSANAAKTWATSTVGGSEPLNSLAYANQTTGWVVLGTPGPNGKHELLRTTNAGHTWHQVSASLTSPGWQPALPVAADAPASSAPYYVWYNGPDGASVVNGFTGKTVATIPSPDQTQFLGIAAARDDRTFVLSTSRRFYELRLGRGGKPQWLATVAGTPPPAGTSFAVSPDARLAAYPTGTGVTVVSLATGGRQSWATGPDGNITDPSWASDRYLAFQWHPLTGRGKAAAGIRLLDTRASTKRPVLADSRLIVSAGKLPIGLRDLFNPIITPDGSKVVTAAWTGPAGSLTAEIAEFSARTGRLLAVLLPPADMPGHGFPCTAVWTDPSGAHLMATCGVAGIVNGTRFTAVDLHLPGTSGITLTPFLAW